jgi:thiamine biosynthesis lipoprotein
MGSAFELGVVAPDSAEANQWLDQGIAEIERLEDLLSEFRPHSLISQINQQAGQGRVTVDGQTFALLQRCQRIAHLTQGYFDPTIGPLKQLYRFQNQAFTMPDAKLIRKTLRQVGYQYLSLDEGSHSVGLTRPGMRLSLAAIGKGYAADCVKHQWQQQGLHAGYINASGDLTAFGHRPDGQPWRIGIASPDQPQRVRCYVPLHDASVATSGDYEQHFTYQGQRYSHNLNPKTGLPLQGLRSVSVFSPSGELSDALATAVYALGRQRGLALIDQLPQTHALLIDDHDRLHLSQHLDYESIA